MPHTPPIPHLSLDPIEPQFSFIVFTITGVCYFWPSLCSDSETVTTTEPTTEVPDYDYEEYDYDYDNDNAV